MNMESILGLCGGLALFLYGMHMMSDGLEAVAGERMKQILEKLLHIYNSAFATLSRPSISLSFFIRFSRSSI